LLKCAAWVNRIAKIYPWQAYANFTAVATMPMADFAVQDSNNPNGNLLTMNRKDAICNKSQMK